MRALTAGCILLVVIMAAGLLFRALPILTDPDRGPLLFGTVWLPGQGRFGLLPFIGGTLWVTATALVIALPLSLLTAIYLSEYAGERLRRWARPLVDLLAGIPSVVYGLWGVVMVVPFVKGPIAGLWGRYTSGYSVLAAGIILAVMILPVIIHIIIEVFQSLPADLRDASLSLGATKWQTVKHVIVRRSLPGIVAACILGLSRAFGETMAVLMVAGNVAVFPSSLLDPAYPLPALIANNYGEMLSIPRYDAALFLAALVLFIIVVLFNAASRAILYRITQGAVR